MCKINWSTAIKLITEKVNQHDMFNQLQQYNKKI